MKNEETYLKNYSNVSSEIKYISNSITRLKIIASLYEGPKNMKQINNETGLSYGAISSNIHNLELNGFIYREQNKYFITNVTSSHISNLMDLKDIILLTQRFFNILDQHIIDIIPNESIMEIFLIGKAAIIESNESDAYKTFNYVENVLKSANNVKCVLPFVANKFINKINDLASNDVPIDLMVPVELEKIFKSSLKKDNFSVFNEKNSFLLISTDSTMVIGFFKDDNHFDQNRLLISKNPDSLKWADNLFLNYKKQFYK